VRTIATAKSSIQLYQAPPAQGAAWTKGFSSSAAGFGRIVLASGAGFGRLILMAAPALLNVLGSRLMQSGTGTAQPAAADSAPASAGDTAAAEAGTPAAEKPKSMWSTAAASAMQSLATGFGTNFLQSAGSQVAGFASEAVKAANERAAAELRLQTVMNRIPGMTAQGIEAMKSYADQLASVTTIDTAAGMAGMAELGEHVGNPKHIQQLSRSMYDLAVFTNGASVSQKQMAQTADVIGRAMAGQPEALAQAGIQMSEAQKRTLAYGTEAQRTATLVGLLNDHVGGFAGKVAGMPEGQIIRLQNAWQGVKAAVGEQLFPAVASLATFMLDKLPAVQAVLTAVFGYVSDAVVGTIGVLQSMWEWMLANWPLVQPILIAIAAVFLASIIAQLYVMAAAWLASMGPILLIVGIIALVIFVLQLCGATMEQIVGAIFGGLMAVFAVLWNKVAAIWDLIASFAEFFINLFIDPVYAVKKLFYDLTMFVLNGFYGMLRGVEGFGAGFTDMILSAVNFGIKSLNRLIEQLNKLPGVQIGTVGLIEAPENKHALSDKLKAMMDDIQAPVSDKNVVHLKRMDRMDIGNAAAAGYDAGAKFGAKLDQLGDKFKAGSAKKEQPLFPDLPGAERKGQEYPPGSGQAGTGSTGYAAGPAGMGSDSVSLSGEDMTILRDLAEMKAVSHYTTLTPTVQVTTGPISQYIDVEEMIRKINQAMLTEIASSARGVY